jgi:drug/metabolite transporter (DMT)-like permease
VLTPSTEPVFATLIFGVAGMLGVGWLMGTRKAKHLLNPGVLLAGLVLGMVNYASLYFIVGALARSGYPASSVFPLMNIGVILFGTASSIALFRERLRKVQWIGIGCAIVALVLIIGSNS